MLANPKIVTSSWFTPIPADHIRIGISRGTPRRMPAGYRQFKILAPGSWFNSVWPDEYRRRYFDEILGPLDPREIVEGIVSRSGGKTPVLCCYEAPHDVNAWCHRGYVSAWLKDTLDLDVPEFGMEADGIGWSHPKLPAAQRVTPAQQSAGPLFDAA